MQIGSNVKWKTDEFEYVGTLTSFNGKRYTIDPGNCLMSFNVGDGTVEPYDGPIPQRTTEVAAITTPLTSKPGSKKEKAVEIFRAMNGASRKDVIQAFITELNMTTAGASTYYAMCKSALN